MVSAQVGECVGCGASWQDCVELYLDRQRCCDACGHGGTAEVVCRRNGHSYEVVEDVMGGPGCLVCFECSATWRIHPDDRGFAGRNDVGVR